MSTEPVTASAEEKRPAEEAAAIHEGDEDEKLQDARKQSTCFSAIIFLQMDDCRYHSRVLFCRLEPPIR